MAVKVLWSNFHHCLADLDQRADPHPPDNSRRSRRENSAAAIERDQRRRLRRPLLRGHRRNGPGRVCQARPRQVEVQVPQRRVVHRRLQVSIKFFLEMFFW